MSKLPTVDSAFSHSFSVGPFQPRQIIVIAQATAPNSGWANPRLSPHFYRTPPADGIWDFDIVADELTGNLPDIPLPLAASGMFGQPDWVKGIRVHADRNKIEIPINSASTSPKKGLNYATLSARNIIQSQLASYDDSFQPVGTCHVSIQHGVSVRMKKLRHTLTAVFEGPDENKINDCINESAAVGVIAAIIAAYSTGGSALQAAVTAFLTNVEGCLGAEYNVRLDDESHWIEWCT